MIKVVFLLLMFSPVLALAEVHKCMSDTGAITYSETNCLAGALPYSGKASAGKNSTRSATLTRGADSAFHADGFVNGQSVNFIVDTGSTLTTLGGDVAYRLGIHNCVPVGVTTTANGEALFCRVVISSLSIAGFNFVNVSVAINPGMKGVALFGNDLLKQFTINQHGDQLTISK